MRLLKTSTYQFGEFFERNIPPYVILSHRWTENEASYQDFLNYQPQSSAHIGPGIEKVRKFCESVEKVALPTQWVWVDTVCIDKKSSAELTEAINSMYSWYAGAAACVVYLHDLLPPPEPGRGQDDIQESDRSAFRRCEWFQRGWTLQELLAPSTVIFYRQDWTVFGDKASLVADLVQATGIPRTILEGTHWPQHASVAMRMSWASRRRTTRPEDAAYCLLGLFDVNMPLLYGEGSKAFMRLQLEIIKKLDDESIFAWTDPDQQRHSWGMLAPSALAFEGCGHIIRTNVYPEERMPFFMTNKGLHFMSSSDSNATDDVDYWTGTPMGYPEHIVKLGCCYGDPENPLEVDADMETLWEERALTVELERRRDTWYRIYCGTMLQVKQLSKHLRQRGSFSRRGVQRLYIVGQPGM